MATTSTIPRTCSPHSVISIRRPAVPARPGHTRLPATQPRAARAARQGNTPTPGLLRSTRPHHEEQGMTATEEVVQYCARRVRRLGVTSDMRDVRIIHELDGIDGEVLPTSLLRTGSELWDAWRRHRDFEPADLLLGLDAGGILPTVAVALASDLPYRLAWKLDLDLPHKRRFSEPHARRADV